MERAKGLYSLAPARLTLKGPPTEATTRLSRGLVCELTRSPARLAFQAGDASLPYFYQKLGSLLGYLIPALKRYSIFDGELGA